MGIRRTNNQPRPFDCTNPCSQSNFGLAGYFVFWHIPASDGIIFLCSRCNYTMAYLRRYANWHIVYIYADIFTSIYYMRRYILHDIITLMQNAPIYGDKINRKEAYIWPYQKHSRKQ